MGGDWDAHRKSLHPNFLRNLKKARNRCRTAGAEVVVRGGAAADPALLPRFLELEGRWIAAHLAIRFGRSLVLLRIAYDETHSRLSPGNVLFGAILERTLERRDAEVVDCLTDQPWHDHWNLEHCPYRMARVFPPRPLPLLLGALPASIRPIARRVLRRGQATSRLEAARGQRAARATSISNREHP